MGRYCIGQGESGKFPYHEMKGGTDVGQFKESIKEDEQDVFIIRGT
jgi:hypothetical protein